MNSPRRSLTTQLALAYPVVRSPPAVGTWRDRGPDGDLIIHKGTTDAQHAAAERQHGYELIEDARLRARRKALCEHNRYWRNAPIGINDPLPPMDDVLDLPRIRRTAEQIAADALLAPPKRKRRTKAEMEADRLKVAA